MSLRLRFRIAFGLIFGLQLATSFGAMALLDRMGPAIARVAADNVESLEAIEEMLGVLAESVTPVGDSGREAFRQAFRRADHKVTEADEPALLAEIRVQSERAFDGDERSRIATVRALRSLGEVNRRAMLRSDAEARRLATAGAWTAAILAVIAFVVARILAERTEREVLLPIGDLRTALEANRQGEGRRRGSAAGAAAEIRAIVDNVNDLLDERAAVAEPEPPGPPVT